MIKIAKKGRQDSSQGENWYVVYAPGCERAVKDHLMQKVEEEGMQNEIFEVLIPEEDEVVLIKGKPVNRKKKILSGYVLVRMIMTDESWGLVRNCFPGVVNISGSGKIPVPVTPEEYGVIKSRMQKSEPKFKTNFSVGDIVKIIDGPFATFEGNVESVDEKSGRLKVLISVFGQDTPMELAFNQVQKK
jgi:transcriptional antiterminator NusG